MGGLFAILDIAKRTLQNNQIQIQTASHNISNADSKTYARQQAVLVTNPVLPVNNAGWAGMGAKVDRITQQRDQFIEQQLMGSSSSGAYYDTKSARLSTVSAYFADDGEHAVSQALGQFWDAWEALNQNPGGLAEQTGVTQATKDLCTTIQQTYNSVTDFAATTENEIKDTIPGANSLLTDIASYNDQIKRIEYNGQTANDLRDLRYQALTKLSELAPVKSQEEADGTLTISLSDYSSNVTLVSGNQAGSMVYDDVNHRMTYSDSAGTAYPIPPEPDPPPRNELSGGKLGALLDVYGSTGVSHDLSFALSSPNDPTMTYLDRLNTLAAAVITQVNGVHTQNGASDVFDAGVLVSTFKASDIQVDPNFTPDATEASNIADLQNLKLPAQPGDPDLGNSTFGEYLSNIQQRIGMDQQNAQVRGKFQDALYQQLQAGQQSVSGVSVDDEMIDLLKFQQVYQAAAKLVHQSATLLDSVIQMV